jgi:AraC-like DNA-binding protein
VSATSVPICFVRSTLCKAAEQGYDCSGLLRQSGVAPALLTQDSARVSRESYAALQAAAMRLMQDESLGYGPRPQLPGTWALACRAAVRPAAMGKVLRRLFKFYAIVDRGIESRVLVEGDDAFIVVGDVETALRYDVFAYEHLLSTFHRFAGWLIKGSLPLLGVYLPHLPPPQPRPYDWLFCSTPVHFGHPVACLRFPARYLEQRVAQTRGSLELFVRNGSLELYDAARETTSWSTRLRQLVFAELTTIEPDFEALAQRLGIHPQTLRRRLLAEGTTFKSIKDAARRDAAEYYLRRGADSVEEIAFKIGFSEASAFVRAFRRWTGVTPHAYSSSVQHASSAAA